MGRLMLLLAGATVIAGGWLSVATAQPALADQSEGTTPAVVDNQRLITVGGLHTCAVLDDGSVECWGANDLGQLGNDSTGAAAVRVKVIGITTAKAVAAGTTHTCALIHDGTVQCWGNNGSEQLGTPSVVDENATLLYSETPVTVQELTDAVAVAAGGFHSCAIVADGTVRCWGLNGTGELGVGGDPDDEPIGKSALPLTVADITPDNPATAITAGEFHTCALLADGTVACWGHNGVGQLGDGTVTDRNAPVAVSGITDEEPARAIVAGSQHTCAAMGDGTARCWGLNEYGQLGDGSAHVADQDPPQHSTSPVTVRRVTNPGPPVQLAALEGVTAITAGQNHSCALRTDGKISCWGNNGRGQLGDCGTGTFSCSSPFELSGDDPAPDRRAAVPVRRSGGAELTGARAVTAGGFHTCALRGTAMECWGYNFFAQLGGYQLSNPLPVTVTAVQGAVTVAAGNGHACALHGEPANLPLQPGDPAHGEPRCWGDNSHGQLGIDGPSHSIVPVEVEGLEVLTAISSGNRFNCALLLGSGAPACWGANGDGQLGDGTTTGRHTPAAVSGLTTATAVSAGGALGSAERGHGCAVLADGTARCWGRNADGQLGDGTTTDRSTPVTVQYDPDPEDDDVEPEDLTDVTAVATGGFHSCALRTDSTVWCWGANHVGQLGDDSNDSSSLAVAVHDEDLPPASAITAGAFHTCAVAEGSAWCWGRNNRGQLGDGTTAAAKKPVMADTDLDVAAVTAGDQHTCSVSPETFVDCWGDNEHGQLGDGNDGGFSADPVAVDELDPHEDHPLTTALSAGRTHTCARLHDTTVRCWGANPRGQLGDGIGPTRPLPNAVLGFTLAGNRLPEPVDDDYTTAPGVAVALDVLANDSDPDGDPLTVTGSTDPADGTAVVAADGTGTYTPGAGFCGTDTFQYLVSDGVATVPATVTVTVTCPNTPPEAVDDTATTGKDTPVTIEVLANDSDPDVDDTLTVTAVGNPANGSAVVNPDNTVTYTPDAGFCGTDTFTYTVSDGTDTASATVTVDVVCVNTPPTAMDDTATTGEETPVTIDVLANDSDADGDVLTVTSVSNPPEGTAVVNPDSTVTYTPEAGFCGTDTFSYTVSDGTDTATATVTVTVDCANKPPVANDDTATTHEDTPVVIDVLANDWDPDGDALTVIAVTDPGNGGAVINADSTVTYTPDPDFCGADQFGYTISDGNGGTASGLVNAVTVICVNDPPVANDDTATTDEDTPVVIDVLANDTDPDGDTLAVIAVSDPPNGSAAVQASGTVAYTPDQDWCGVDTFTYTISDPDGETDSATVTVTVDCVNDPPVIAPVADRTTPWGEELAVALSAEDVDGDPITFSLVAGPAGVSVDPDSGLLTWQPTESQVGTHAVEVRASDPDGETSDTTFGVSVTARPAVVLYTGAESGQYSDPVAVSATVSDALSGAPVPGRTVAFTIKSLTASAATDDAGVASASITLSTSPGETTVSAAFAGDSGYTAAAGTSPFTVEKELVEVTFTGQHLTTTSGTSATVSLSATVREDDDGSFGSALGTAQVTFGFVPSGTLCTATVTVTGPGQGTATCNATVSLGSRPVMTTLASAAYAGPVDVSVLTVAQSVKGGAAGAGRVADAGERDDFGFQARPERRAAVSGDAVHVFRAVTDLGDGPREYALVVRSNSPTALSTSCSGGKDKICSAVLEADGASTRAVDLATGEQTDVAGVSTLRIDTTDVAEPAGGDAPPDRYAVDVTGTPAHTLGAPSAQLLLSAGNIRVTS